MNRTSGRNRSHASPSMVSVPDTGCISSQPRSAFRAAAWLHAWECLPEGAAIRLMGANAVASHRTHTPRGRPRARKISGFNAKAIASTEMHGLNRTRLPQLCPSCFRSRRDRSEIATGKQSAARETGKGKGQRPGGGCEIDPYTLKKIHAIALESHAN